MEDRKSKKPSPGGINFLVTIHNQENNSWQGYIQWLDTGKKVHFRSELEMIMLMQNAVKLSGGGDDFRTWDNGKKKNVG
jgi:hypothetical protein